MKPFEIVEQALPLKVDRLKHFLVKVFLQHHH